MGASTVTADVRSISATALADHDVPLGSFTPGNRVTVLLYTDSNEVFTVDPLGDWDPGAWTTLVTHVNSINNQGSLIIVYREMESGDPSTLRIQTGTVEESAAVIWEVTGHEPTQAPEYSLNEDRDTTPDSPVLTPSWGNSTLWASFFGADNSTPLSPVSAYPLAGHQGTALSSGGSGGVVIGFCDTESDQASLNPSYYTCDGGDDDWTGVTLTHRDLVVGGAADAIPCRMQQGMGA